MLAWQCTGIALLFQVLETVNEEDKIPDYQELEERTDSEGYYVIYFLATSRLVKMFVRGPGGGRLPYIRYIGMCCCEEKGFDRIG